MKVVNILGTVGLGNFCNGTSAFARDVIDGMSGDECHVNFFSPSDLKPTLFIFRLFRRIRRRVLKFTMSHRLDVFFVLNLMITFSSFYFFLRKKKLSGFFLCNDVLCAHAALLLSKDDVFLVTHFIVPPWDEFVRGGYIRDGSIGYRMLKKWMLLIFKNKRLRYLFVSEGTKHLVRGFVGNENLYGRVVYNGINVQQIKEKTLNKLRDKRYVINIGTLCANKNQERFVRVASILSKNDPSLYFVLVGDGEQDYRLKLEKLVKSEGLTNKVIFMGLLNKEEAHEAIAMAELYFHTSLVDNTPRVLIESMAYGTVACCIEYGHAHEIVGVNDSLIFLREESDEEIGEKITGLLTNKNLMNLKRAEQSGRFAEKFCLDKMVASISEYLFNESSKNLKK